LAFAKIQTLVVYSIHSWQWYSALIPRWLTVGRVAYTVVRLVTLECSRGVINRLYHCRHSPRDKRYDCDRGIRADWCWSVASNGVVLVTSEGEVGRWLVSQSLGRHLSVERYCVHSHLSA